MLGQLITFALRQRWFVLILCGILLIAGLRAAINLPVEAFPDVQDVQVQVVTQAPGVAPEEVERTISQPVEREMSGVPHLTQIRSVSITGLSVVTLTFADHTDDYFARQQVLEHMGDVTLPPGANFSLAPLTTAIGEIYRYIIEAPPGASKTDIRSAQDWVIRPILRQTPGVADVVSFGGAVREYQVQVDPAALRKYGISLDQISDALGKNNANGSGGVMPVGDQALVVRSIGLLESTADIEATPVTSRDGLPITVAQIGRVLIGGRPRSGIVAFDKQDDVVEGIVQMIKGQNPATVIETLKENIKAAEARLPPGYKIHTIYDRTNLVDNTVHTVAENMVTGALLVIAILIVFLRSWKVALVVAAVIPLSLLSAFIVMDIRGMNANLISLGAVDFGIIIDSAVVLVEALMVRLALDTYRPTSDDDKVRHRTQMLKGTAAGFGKPVLFSKAIIILAFLPIFTFQRVEGKIFSPMAFTLSFALLGAIILTLTFIPAALSWMLKGDTLKERHSRWMHWLQEKYSAGLDRLLPKRLLFYGLSVAAVVVTLILAPRLGSEFLPNLDEGNLWLTMSLPPATNLDASKRVERQVRAILQSYPEVGEIVSHVGRPDDGTDPKGPNNIEMLADLHKHGTWRAQFHDKEQLIADMTKRIHAIPGVPTNFSQVIQDNVEEALSGVKGAIAVKVFGPNLDILQQKADQIAAILNSIPGAADVGVNRVGGQTELDIRLNRAALSRLGLKVDDVNTTVQTALGGSAASTFYEGDRRYDLTLRLDPNARASVEDVESLPVILPTGGDAGGGASAASSDPSSAADAAGGSVPLGSVADIEVRQGAARILRENGGRVVAIKSNLLGRDQGSFVAEAQRRVAAEVHLPPGYHVTWGGQFENQQRATKRLMVVVPLSVLGIFLLLFWNFRSLKLSIMVLALVPFTLIGGLGALALEGLHMSVSAAVGFIAVAGICVQNGVILVEQVIELAASGRPMGAAIREGSVLRLRPIIMTALMAGIGLLPAALSHGIGSETQRPFAAVIVGGIVTATLFTITLLPIMLNELARGRRDEDGEFDPSDPDHPSHPDHAEAVRQRLEATDPAPGV